MKVEKTEAKILAELDVYRRMCSELRVDLEVSKREKKELAEIAEMARKKLSKENDELRAGLRQANELIATNLGVTHKLADSLTKTSVALEEAHRGINILSAFIEYQMVKK